MFLEILKLLRPKQWIKNLLLASAPLAAGVFPTSFPDVIISILGFICASILGYIFNDWMDRESDSLHESKKHRPFASKKLGFKHLILLLPGLISCVIFSCISLPIHYSYAILFYLFITFSYTLKIKEIAVIEMLWLTFGFLVRAVAGAAATDVTVSSWFLILVGFGAMFLVSAKRLSEMQNYNAFSTRRVISNYSERFILTVINASLTITLLTFSFWVFEIHPDSNMAKLSILPFTAGIFLYAWHCETGDAESPEKLLFKDPKLVICGVLTAVILIFETYQ